MTVDPVRAATPRVVAELLDDETRLCPETLSDRRRRALGEVRVELATTPCAAGPAIATRLFAPGRLVVALGGEFDLAASERLGALLRDLRRVAVSELALDLGAVVSWPPRLTRVVGRARIQCLIDGVRVELHQLPASMRDALAGPGMIEHV